MSQKKIPKLELQGSLWASGETGWTSTGERMSCFLWEIRSLQRLGGGVGGVADVALRGDAVGLKCDWTEQGLSCFDHQSLSVPGTSAGCPLSTKLLPTPRPPGCPQGVKCAPNPFPTHSITQQTYSRSSVRWFGKEGMANPTDPLQIFTLQNIFVLPQNRGLLSSFRL